MNDPTSPPGHGFPGHWYSLGGREHFWFQWRFRALLRQLETCGPNRTDPLKGLDVGCGHGVLRGQLEQAFPWTIDGVDLNDDALKHCDGFRGHTFRYDIHERRTELVQFYDLVLLFDILEHIPDVPGFLSAAVDHLRPGGWLLVNVPALPSMFSVYDKAAGHLRRYCKNDVKNVLALAGLEPLDVRFWGLTLLPLAMARKVVLSLAKRDQDQVLTTGFEPPSRLVNSLLKGLARVETGLFPKMPLGTSLLAVARKPE